jgi:hypothetical protein
MSEEQLELPLDLPKEPSQEELLAQMPDSNHSPSDIASAFYALNEKKLKRCLEKLSVRQLRRVIMLVASYPLRDVYKTNNIDERGASYLLNEMVMNKVIMQLQVESERAEAAQKAEEEREKLNTTNNETLEQGVQTNG